MLLNLITSAKGGVGKTFLCFLYFLDCYMNPEAKGDRKFIFIDHNFINKDMYNIISTHFPLTGKPLRFSSQFRYEIIKNNKDEEKILFIWNDDDSYFPNRMEVIRSLKNILSDEIVTGFIGRDNKKVEVFIDTNLHLKYFYVKEDATEYLDFIKNLKELRDMDIDLRILFIWSFALLLGQRSVERDQTIKNSIEVLSKIWKKDNYDWETAFLKDYEKEFLKSIAVTENKGSSERNNNDSTLEPEAAWSIDKLIHVFNYYTPFDEMFSYRIKTTLRQLETISKKGKEKGKGVSFNLINKTINEVTNKEKGDIKDLNSIKTKVIEAIRSKICRNFRPDNILILPTFNARITGFTEKMAEISIDKSKDLVKEKKAKDVRDSRYEDLLIADNNYLREIINEIQLREVLL